VDSHLIASLPDILQEYWHIEDQREITDSEAMFFLFVYPLLLVNLTSFIGLFFLKKWAKWGYIGTTVIMIVLSPFAGPTVEHGLVSTLHSLEFICAGFIFAMLFLTDVISTNKDA